MSLNSIGTRCHENPMKPYGTLEKIKANIGIFSHITITLVLRPTAIKEWDLLAHS